jgi:phosphopantothenoylcysteine synthetase/decarboxylase
VSEPVVILGVTGSIAAYKAAEITSRLTKAGVAVHVVMTASAERFITPLTFQTLSRHEVVRHEPTVRPDWKPVHIELADSASLLLIAPATANILAELAHGFASHPLTEIALANRAPLLLAPAMNGHMWQHPATQANIEILSSRGARFVGPEDGQLACGYEGIGRMAEPETVVKAALSLLQI